MKINDQIFKFKKPYFWLISQFLGAKKVFPKNWAVMHNFIRVSGTMSKSRKIQRSNSIKTPRQMSGGKDGQIYFIGSFQLPPGV